MTAIPGKISNPLRCRTAAASTANAALEIAIACHDNRPRAKPAIRLTANRIAELKALSYAGDWVTRSIRRRGEPAFR
jgi:hypothetical protein